MYGFVVVHAENTLMSTNKRNIIYNEYWYPEFLHGLIVSELSVIIDNASLRTITRQQHTYPSRASDDLLELHVVRSR